jgi:osmotically-inducible protein OsmY
MKRNILILGATIAAAVGIYVLTSPSITNNNPETPAKPHLVSAAQAASPQSRIGYTGSDPALGANATSDSLIHGAIIREIIQENLAGVMSSVRVNVRNGAVTLTGTVPTEIYRQRLGVIASGVVSSASVDNEVVVSG